MTEVEHPLVSVLMSVYNGETYLREAVESILNQTYRDFEFIIMDDGSRDASGKILKEYAAKDARIRLFFRSNVGLTKSLNEAIRHSRGRYLARMDADDVSMPLRFQKQLEYLSEHEDCVLLGSEVLLIDAEGWAITRRGHVFGHEEIDRQLLRGDGGGLTHPVVMMRRDAVQSLGGYREEFVTAQDLDLFLRLAEMGRVANLPEMLLKWRQHPGSINHTRYHTWAKMKEMALTGAARRRALKLDLDKILKNDRQMPQKIDFHFVYAELAAESVRYFPTGLKHLGASIRKGGFHWRHTREFLFMLKQVAKGIYNRAGNRGAKSA